MTITLYCFRPAAGLPDASPFVTKAMVLLKMAGLDYVEDRNGFSKAPKGKQPYINDDGDIVADSTFIRFHIEQKYSADFDAHLSESKRRSAGASRKCARSISIGSSSACAGWMTRISNAVRRVFSTACPPSRGRWRNGLFVAGSPNRYGRRAWAVTAQPKSTRSAYVISRRCRR